MTPFERKILAALAILFLLLLSASLFLHHQYSVRLQVVRTGIADEA
jgi:hypothetical protein